MGPPRSATSIESLMRASVLCGFSLALGLAGCSSDHSTTPVAATPTRTLQGAIVKGPLAGATVDAHGHVTAGLPVSDEPLLAMSFGGSYVDESDDAGGDNRRHITLTDD